MIIEVEIRKKTLAIKSCVFGYSNLKCFLKKEKRLSDKKRETFGQSQSF